MSTNEVVRTDDHSTQDEDEVEEPLQVLVAEGLDSSVTLVDVRKMFIPHNAQLCQLFNKNGKHCAFIEFSNHIALEAAKHVMNGKTLKSKPLHLYKASDKDIEYYRTLNTGGEINEEDEVPQPTNIHYTPLPPLALESMSDITNVVFCLIHVEATLSSKTTTSSFGPYELSIIKMSIKHGELANFHRFIDPGQLPQCHISEIIWKSGQSGILHSGFKFLEKNYRKLWMDICAFVEFPHDGEIISQSRLPILVAKRPSVKTESLQWLCDKAGFNYYFGKVKPVEEIVWLLFQKRGLPVKTSQIQYSFSILNQESTNGSNSVKPCEYHEDEGQQQKQTFQCTLSIARQLVWYLRNTYSLLYEGKQL